METIYYKHENKTIRKNINDKLCISASFSKNDRRFACDISELNHIGVNSVPIKFKLTIEENGHSKIFDRVHVSKDEENEIRYWKHSSTDGYQFTIFND